MNTTQNRATVLAMTLRRVLREVRDGNLIKTDHLEQIESVAEELETVAAAPSDLPTGDLTDADNNTIMRGLEHVARHHDSEIREDPSRRHRHEVYAGVCRLGAGRIKALVDLTWDRA